MSDPSDSLLPPGGPQPSYTSDHPSSSSSPSSLEASSSSSSLSKPLSSSLSSSSSIRQLPKPVYLILGMEFCERFSFYGLRAVLYVYFLQFFDFSEAEATLFFHLFVMAAYLTPILGGFLSDNYLGKFSTIWTLGLVYVGGTYLLAITAIPGVTGVPPSAWGAAVSLVLVALGTGGIKPCVSSFGADQVLSSKASNALQVQLFFSLFYFAINIGSVLSTLITPQLRSISCYGNEECFSLAFGVPAILMSVAIIIFLVGKPLYTHVAPERNVMVKVVASIAHAVRLGCCCCFGASAAQDGSKGGYLAQEDIPIEEEEESSSSSSKHLSSSSSSGKTMSIEHWMDRAKQRYGHEFVEDVKTFLGVLLVLTPAPFFWALFDQSASKWVQQATEMNRYVGTLYIPPDTMQVCNSLFILLLIPTFEKFLYPLIRRCSPFRPLMRMGLGLVFTVLSFVIAGFVQLQINQGTFAADPSDPDCEKCCIDGCVNIMAQIPQYLVLTAGEVMFSVTGLEFAYSQAPPSLRSVCSAFWLLTVAFGNLVVIIISGSQLFDNRAYEFFFYAGLLLVVSVGFVFLARRYRYSSPITA